MPRHRPPGSPPSGSPPRSAGPTEGQPAPRPLRRRGTGRPVRPPTSPCRCSWNRAYAKRYRDSGRSPPEEDPTPCAYTSRFSPHSGPLSQFRARVGSAHRARAATSALNDSPSGWPLPAGGVLCEARAPSAPRPGDARSAAQGQEVLPGGAARAAGSANPRTRGCRQGAARRGRAPVERDRLGQLPAALPSPSAGACRGSAEASSESKVLRIYCVSWVVFRQWMEYRFLE